MRRATDETRDLFDNWASTYDADVDRPGQTDVLTGYEESLQRAADMLPPMVSSRVLDIGIGTGTLAQLVALEGTEIHGIDISTKMLAECGRKHPEFSLKVGSFTEVPYPAEFFDAVISSFAFHHVEAGSRLKACSEVFRVLKPGGRLCLLDIMFISGAALEAAKQRIGHYWDDEEDYPLVAELDETLREAGFSEILWRQTGPWHWAVICRRPS